MASFKQELIGKILSFNYRQVCRWIKASLHGCDMPSNFKQSKPGKFLFELFCYIKEEKFREDFLESLCSLTRQLKGFSTDQVEESKDYIFELLYLCGEIKQFKDKESLLEMAVTGNFKGVKTDAGELHATLLKVLASHNIAGDPGFWTRQLLNESGRDYAFPAFWALQDNLDILFGYMGTFIDRWGGDPDLEAAIRLLIYKYKREQVAKRFNVIAPNLSIRQKQSVNKAFAANGFDAVYQLKAAEPAGKGLQYKLAVPRVQYISQSNPEYEPTSLKQKSSRIFRFMGYDVEFDRSFARYPVDIFIKKKDEFSNDYECWICLVNDEKCKVGKKEISRLYSIREAARKELENESDDCQAMVISESEKDFTKKAVETAQMYKIELLTINRLTSNLKRFKEKYEKLIRNIQSLTREES
jgi:hypothetical protein